MRISDWSSDVCSSDLADREQQQPPLRAAGVMAAERVQARRRLRGRVRREGIEPGFEPAQHRGGLGRERAAAARRPVIVRSEEHTSELQSLMRISYAVFCLKKKTKDT